MKIITAIVRPLRLEDVRAAIEQAGVLGLTVTDTNGYGQQKGRTQVYRSVAFQVDAVQRAKIEVVVNDESVDTVVAAIINAARTGKIGDGKLWVTPVDSFIQIRNGERYAEPSMASEFADAPVSSEFALV
jgi:nitrogen regulatory protein P-II 1